MSTSTRTEAPETRLAPCDVFDAVWNDPTTCNGCFAQIRQRTEFSPVPGVSEYAPDVELRRAHAGVGGRHPADLPTAHASTYCSECGNEHGRASGDTLSRREMLTRVPQLADRVEALGASINRGMLSLFIRRAKERESLQGHDTEIFRRGVTVAVRHADS